MRSYLLLCLLLCLPLTASRPLQEKGNKTYRPLYQLKAAWISTLLKFVRWPKDGEEDTIVIIMLGSEDFQNLFDYYQTNPIRGKKLVVKHYETFQGQADLSSCHLLYISDSERDAIDEIMAFLGEAPVLTLSEVDAFIRRGGIVHFKVRGDKFKYEVNQRLANSRGLYISSQILGRADRVIRP